MRTNSNKLSRSLFGNFSNNFSKESAINFRQLEDGSFTSLAPSERKNNPLYSISVSCN